MSDNDRLLYFATAPKAAASPLHLIEDGRTVERWVGRLRHHYVGAQGPGNWEQHDDCGSAVAAAERFLAQCRQEAAARGLYAE